MAIENDIVLIHLEDTPLSYARIEAIKADVKPDWYQVKLLLLQVPLTVATWILREAYINGDEFTMGGKRMRLEKIVVPVEEAIPDEPPPETKQKTPAPKAKGGANVISFNKLKK
jgi:hypothetical protein